MDRKVIKGRKSGQNVSNAEEMLPCGNNFSAVPNDRVRAFALWEGWFGYDRKKYAAMLREAFQPFELFVAEPTPQDDSSQIRADEEWQDTPLFSALRLPHPRV
jgi:hypothetical protein